MRLGAGCSQDPRHDLRESSSAVFTVLVLVINKRHLVPFLGALRAVRLNCTGVCGCFKSTNYSNNLFQFLAHVHTFTTSVIVQGPLNRSPLLCVCKLLFCLGSQRERDLQHKPHSWQEKGEHQFEILILSTFHPCRVLASVASYRNVGALAASSQIRGKV